MKKKLKAVLRHPLISGSAIIFLGTNIGNVFNFFFSFFMLHNLTPVDFGILIGLLSIITLFAQVADSMTPFVVNYAAIYFSVGEVGKAKTLFLKVTKMSAFAGLSILVVFLVFSEQIGEFLKISDSAYIISAALCIFFGYLGTVNKAFLQAKLAFTFLAIIVCLGSFLKFSVGAFFVMYGFGVQGALYAFMIAFIIPYVLTFFPLKQLLLPSQRKEHIELRKMMQFGMGSVLVMLGVTLFVTTDILLVKHLFSPRLAGLYAGMTTVGKIIFYFSAPISSVMFPIIVQKFAKKENYHIDFLLSLGLLALPSLILTMIYFLFPELVIHFVMKRDEYLAAGPYLGLVGIFFTFYSLLFVLVNFFLSIQKTYIFAPVLLAALLQGLGIWFFHSSLFAVLWVSIITSGLLLATLLLYYLKINSQKRESVRFSF